MAWYEDLPAVYALADQIAEHLKGFEARQVVNPVDGYPRVYLVHPSDDLHILVIEPTARRERAAGRLILLGCLPPTRAAYDLRGFWTPSITIGRGRDPRALAGDISRRLLPTYRHVLRSAVAHIDAKGAQRLTQQVMAERLAQLLPSGHHEATGWNDELQRITWDTSAVVSGHLEIRPSQSAEIAVTTRSGAFLLDLAALITRHNEYDAGPVALDELLHDPTA